MDKKIKKKESNKQGEYSVIIEAVYLDNGTFKYIVSSNQNLKLGLCKISN